MGTVAGLTRGVFSLDWLQHRVLAVAGGDAAVRLFEVRDVIPGESESKGDDVL